VERFTGGRQRLGRHKQVQVPHRPQARLRVDPPGQDRPLEQQDGDTGRVQGSQDLRERLQPDLVGGAVTQVQAEQLPPDRGRDIHAEFLELMVEQRPQALRLGLFDQPRPAGIFGLDRPGGRPDFGAGRGVDLHARAPTQEVVQGRLHAAYSIPTHWPRPNDLNRWLATAVARAR